MTIKEQDVLEVKQEIDKGYKYESPGSSDVRAWPEFQSLAKKLGIDFGSEFTDMSIFVPAMGNITITFGDTTGISGWIHRLKKRNQWNGIIEGFVVLWWPEFLALMDRFAVDISGRVLNVTIDIQLDEQVYITVKEAALDRQSGKK